LKLRPRRDRHRRAAGIPLPAIGAVDAAPIVGTDHHDHCIDRARLEGSIQRLQHVAGAKADGILRASMDAEPLVAIELAGEPAPDAVCERIADDGDGHLGGRRFFVTAAGRIVLRPT
jgi:hypothetical protein